MVAGLEVRGFCGKVGYANNWSFWLERGLFLSYAGLFRACHGYELVLPRE